LIGEKKKSTTEIFEGLKKAGEGLSKSGLYYHLSEMAAAGIIELAEYREVGGGAPEKVWKLKTKEIKINLLTDLPKTTSHE
jgi:DNA-binding transcriptional ArsR family regulator